MVGAAAFRFAGRSTFPGVGLTGVTEAGAWRYAFAYAITACHYPNLIEQAQSIGENEACRVLAQAYLCSVGAARQADIRKLFGWRPAAVERTVNALLHSGVVQRVNVEKEQGEWLALSELLQ